MNSTDILSSVSLEDLDKKFVEVQKAMYELQKAKTVSYGNSCYKRGLIGVVHNVFRKTDRLDNINSADPMSWENPDSVGGECILDTISDASVYLSKLIVGYAFTHPDLFNKFLSDIYKFVEEVNSRQRLEFHDTATGTVRE